MKFGKDIFSAQMQTSTTESDLLEEICSDEELGDLGQSVCSAIDYDNKAVLQEKTVEDMFEKELKGSATRLGTFAGCPYRYFARYVLDLKKRKEFSLEPLDLGNFYHSVLDALVKRINAEHINFANIDNDSLIKILNEEIEKFIKANSFLSHFINRRVYNEFIIDSACEVLQDFVPVMTEMIRAGNFRPCVSEIAFGNVKESTEILGVFELELPDNNVISLSGKIDRLDVAEIDNEQKAVVFDYKRRDTASNGQNIIMAWICSCRFIC